MASNLRDKDGLYRIPEHPKKGTWISVTKVLDHFANWEFVHRSCIASHVQELAMPYEPVLARAKESPESLNLALELAKTEMWIEDESGIWSKVLSPNIYALLDRKHIGAAGFRFLQKASSVGLLMDEVFRLHSEGAGISSEAEMLEALEHECIFAMEDPNLERFHCEPKDALAPALALWDWLEKERPRILAIQFPVFNDTYGYAGSPDALVQYKGSLWVWDCKRVKQVTRDHLRQQAAYSYAERYYPTGSRTRRTRWPNHLACVRGPLFPPPIRSAIIHIQEIGESGRYKVVFRDVTEHMPESFEAFKRRLQCWRDDQDGPTAGRAK